MTLLEKTLFLNKILLEEMPEYKEQSSSFKKNYEDQRILLRSLMNLRPPVPINAEFLAVQNELLKEETLQKDIISIDNLSACTLSNQVYLWQGDITNLKVDAIVNAANSALLGCFIPCHKCIDNAIHSVAGLELRDECNKIMLAQEHPEKTGNAKITGAYNLLCKHVIHTVGPIISKKLTDNDRELLKNCYKSCLDLAIDKNLKSIAFCCISTGEFHFPNDEAAKIAVSTVLDTLKTTKNDIKVIFNVFKELDYKLYRELLY